MAGHKFDPANAARLDAPERDAFLPDDAVLGLLDLRGDEVLVDYGAGTGRLSLAAAALLPRGRVVAVDESARMVELLRERTGDTDAVEVLAIEANEVPLADASADVVLAVNLLHEIVGETALAEMRRLLRPGGRLLAVDWARGRTRPVGPPDEHLLSDEQMVAMLEEQGLDVVAPAFDAPYHAALIGVAPEGAS